MFAKSFIAFDGNGRLAGARTAQTAPYDRYTCHLCGSALQYHPEYNTERPWFEHRHETQTENGQQHCPYIKPDRKETLLIRQLQSYVPDAHPLVFQADWYCNGCDSDYHGERYCLTCRTGEHSHMLDDAEKRATEVMACAC
ncbi:hypothetical protein I4T90_001793 [Salmonella enterica subsp. enterica serovar Panama]|uniref:DNA-directed RNA polymerase, beta subunit/140 kD subunit n=1 Tax=Salmonella enterica subsp. enterica serovar Panama TaxID=29472 RepID=A0A751YXS5_SALET|nr:hypothetical protein [Salmonella enterica]EGS7285592.1 hypothetical protein [Salmonella enterica subsp. enterica serovar Panama]EGS7544144.1 hypothetical protein [Salmonella enterica subsp. enterica serovar Panama]EHC9769180.1 hypothetical protein [Salmonella enterica subsp. enterica serovar Panama]HAF7258879.1 hypothetical protein [Salmonella enterica subsp. enterica serovar Panama]